MGLVACQIVANNAFSGHLTKAKDGGPIATADFNSVLLEKEYYFHVSSSDPLSQYPVIPSFQDRKFPHGQLPDIWQSLRRETAPGPISAQSNIAASICVRDGPCCRLTGYGDGLESARVVPEAEWEWFTRNNMMQYNRYHQLLGIANDARNCISLRTGVHRVFNECRLMFVPKPVPPVATDTAFTDFRESSFIDLVAHFLIPTASLHLLYHNAIIHPINDICPEFFFARFAWYIFPFLNAFLTSQCSRKLIMHSISDSSKPEVQEKLFSGKECSELACERSERKRRRLDSQTSSLASPSRTRSHSPNSSSRHISPDDTYTCVSKDTIAFQGEWDLEQEMRGRKGCRYF